jgi:AcrR family transcriptional regulator
MATHAPAWRRLQPDARRAEILSRTRKLFVEQPYDSISTEDLAKAAGITRGALYHYFANKRALYLEVIRELTRELPQTVRIDPSLPREELFAVNADAYLDYAERNREAWLGILRGGVGRDPEVEAILDEAREATVDRILINQLGTPDGPPEARFMVRCAIGLGEAATREWLEHGRASREQVRMMLMRGITALAAAGASSS